MLIILFFQISIQNPPKPPLSELHEGQMEYVDHHLKQGEQFVIQSFDPGLCIIFFQVYGTTIQIYSNNEIYADQKDPSPLGGIDFGNTLAKIIFTAQNDVQLRFSLLVFPTNCIHHRLISTRFYDTIEFSLNSSDPDYQIQAMQSFCYWNALPVRKNYHIITNTEKSFDRLKRFSPNGHVGDFSGIMDVTFNSPTSIDYFYWHSDESINSSYFLINMSSLDFFPSPIIYSMLSDNAALDVTPFYQNIPFPEQTPSETYSTLHSVKFLPYFAIISLTVFVISIFLSIWAIKICIGRGIEKSAESFKFKEVDDTQKHSKQSSVPQSGYNDANGDKLPQPWYDPDLEQVVI